MSTCTRQNDTCRGWHVAVILLQCRTNRDHQNLLAGPLLVNTSTRMARGPPSVYIITCSRSQLVQHTGLPHARDCHQARACCRMSPS
jgi:hypothetical protein